MELAKLNGEIAEVERDLGETVQPAFDDAKTAATGMADERDEARRRMEGLYAKQGRGKQFRTKKERDAHLRPQPEPEPEQEQEQEQEEPEQEPPEPEPEPAPEQEPEQEPEEPEQEPPVPLPIRGLLPRSPRPTFLVND